MHTRWPKQLYIAPYKSKAAQNEPIPQLKEIHFTLGVRALRVYRINLQL